MSRRPVGMPPKAPSPSPPESSAVQVPTPVESRFLMFQPSAESLNVMKFTLAPSVETILALAPPAPEVHCESSEEQIVARAVFGWPEEIAIAVPPVCDQVFPLRRQITAPSGARLISFWSVPRLVALVYGPSVQVCASTFAARPSDSARSTRTAVRLRDTGITPLTRATSLPSAAR